jgi:hypothetical protein
MKIAKLLVTAAIGIASMTFASAVAEAAGDPRPALVAVRVVQAPDPMFAKGKAYLVYELLLTSFDSSPVTLTGLRVAASKGASRREFRFKGEEFRKMLRPLAGHEADSNLTRLDPASARMVFVWLPFDSAAVVPAELQHFVGYSVKREREHTGEIKSAPLRVDEAPAISVGPPLAGGEWIADSAPSNTSAHRGARMVVDGEIYFAQRYAIDFEKLGADGRTHSGDPKKNASYFCYGLPVFAVADGRVVAMKDGIPENTPATGTRAVEINFDTVGGNHVVLDIGFGRYAFYAHMIPGSLLVNVGDMVKRGQVLGKVGNSGNSTEPHLHFHIVDRPSFLAANGRPYLFEDITVKSARNIGAGDEVRAEIAGPAKRYLSTLVLEDDVITFPSQQ